jgi:threonyl-tRNA synthetase
MRRDLKAYLHMLEEAEKRDHRKLGREMDLFHFQEEGPGTVFWHPKGWTLFQNLTSYMRRRIGKDGYKEVNAPQVLDKSLWETSGHWGWYSENMFGVKAADALVEPDDENADQRVFALKPMNCPGHVQIFKHGLKSYRDLPMRLAEFGAMCTAMNRRAHCTDCCGCGRSRRTTRTSSAPRTSSGEILKINDLMMSVYEDFGFEEVEVKLATRPEKRVGQTRTGITPSRSFSSAPWSVWRLKTHDQDRN